MNKPKESKKVTASEEIKAKISKLYTLVENWIRPSKKHSTFINILLFLLKLPVLILGLLLSPILLVILLLAFLIAL